MPRRIISRCAATGRHHRARARRVRRQFIRRTGKPTACYLAAPSSPFPVQMPRSDGKSLTLPQAPARLVSLSPGATEIIYALGAEGELAAVDKQSDYPTKRRTFPTKLDAYEPNVEAIAALKPDLVFVHRDHGRPRRCARPAPRSLCSSATSTT